MPLEKIVNEQDDSIAGRISEFLSRHERAAIGTLLALYAFSALLSGRVRPLWFDEMGTMIVAGQPTLHQMFVAAPPDGQPPLYYLLARASMHLFGTNAYALRLPALLAFLVAGLCVYIFVRRRTGPLCGLLAVVTLCASEAAIYAMEARPYSMMLGGMGLALVCWQSAASRVDEPGISGRRLGALAGLTIAIAIAILSHAYGVFCIVMSVGVGEAVRTIYRRRLDFPLLLAGIVGFSALAVTVPMAHRSQQTLFAELGHGTAAIAVPSRSRLFHDSGDLIQTTQLRMVALLAFLSLCGWPRVRSSPRVALDDGLSNIPKHEIAAVVGLTGLLLVAWIFARVVTHYYFWRYGVGTALGLAVLTAWLVWVLPFRKVMATAIVVASSLSAFYPGLHAFFGPHPTFDRSALLEKGPADLDIVEAGALEYPSVWFYSSPQLRERLYYVAERQYRTSLEDPIPEITLAAHASRHTLPMHLEGLEPFLATHPRFLLYASDDGEPREWLPAELRRRGYHLDWVGSKVYDHPDVLFLVTAPDSAGFSSSVVAEPKK